jgi:Cytotoxic
MGCAAVGRKPIPRPSLLDACAYLGYVDGERRWRSADGKELMTWDSLHGEVEVYNRRGRHIGTKDPISGVWIKNAVRGRRIDV